MKSVISQFICHVKSHPNKLFIESELQDLTYETTLSYVKKIVMLFNDENLQVGDRVALHLPNTSALVCSYLACFYAGLVPVPLGTYLTGAELNRVILNAAPKYIITFDENIERNKAELELDHRPTVLFSKKLSDYFLDEHIVIENIEPKAVEESVIHYTSGSTGAPKGVVHTQLNKIMYNYTESGKYEANDKILVTLFLTHGFAFSFQFLPAVSVGATLIIPYSREPDNVIKFLKESTTWCAIPSLVNTCLNILQQNKDFKHRLRNCVVGGDIVTPALIKKFNSLFGIKLSDCWGLTEGFCVTLNFSDKVGSSGTPCSGNNIRVDDTGEICVSGDSVMTEYYNNSDASNAVLKSGWLYTGDYGEIDTEGHLWFKGRIKDIVVIKGHNVSPLEVEQELHSFGSIYEIAVIGIPDAEYGSTLIAVYSAEKSLDQQALNNYLSNKLSLFKLPTEYYFLDSLPKTSLGKIDKKMLIEKYSPKQYDN